jgi:monooxygenase
MDRHGVKKAVPKPDPSVKEEAFLTFTSGYIQRAKDHVPKQGDKAPWRLYMNYALDTLAIRYGEIADGALKMTGAPARSAEVRGSNGAMRPATAAR